MGLFDRWRRAQTRWDRRAHLQTIARLPGLAALPAGQLARLEALAQHFAVDKRFHAVGGGSVSPAQIATIATLACWPMLNLGSGALAGWSDLVLYPTGFRARRHQVEVAEVGLDVVHEYDEELAGEASEDGVVVLAWEEICLDLEHPADGQSVVIHEIAHMFDAQSGAVDGRPPLLPGMSADGWTRSFQQAFEKLRARVDDDQETLMDPYAAEAPEEFFAVAVEHYCLRPDLLEAECPAVAGLLQSLFGTVSA
jgi:MtfA peptidase